MELLGYDSDYLNDNYKVNKSPYNRKVSKTNRKLTYIRDNYSCVYCGSKKNLTVDHIIPVSRGGSNELSNLMTLCVWCNSKKSDQMPKENKLHKLINR